MKLRGQRLRKLAGQPAARAANQPPPPPPPPGQLQVTVVASSDASPVSGAAIEVRDQASASTGGDGKAALQLPAGTCTVRVTLRDPALDHVTFYSHYPEVTRSHEATASRAAAVEVRPGEVAELRVELAVLELLRKVVLFRRHIDLGGEDKYGHWWTVIDEVESFGWWPRYPLGHPASARSPEPVPPPPLQATPSAVERIQHFTDSVVYHAQRAFHSVSESGPVQTLRGVEGELNGRTSFGGSAKRYGDAENLDPHHVGGDQGDVRYQPIVARGADAAALKDAMRTFADAYAGGWSWRFELGNHCHTFQKRLLALCDLDRFRAV